MLQNPQLHYLDNAATTIVAPEVADVIDKAMREHWANPSSLYGLVDDIRHLGSHHGGSGVIQIMQFRVLQHKRDSCFLFS